MSVPKNSIQKMTDGGLVKSNIVKHGEYLTIPLEPLDGFDFEYILITYSKAKRELKLIGIDGVDGSRFIDLTVYAEGDPTRLMLMVSGKVFPKKYDLLWTSGICNPSSEMVERLNLKENACVWEGILKIATDYSSEEIEKGIHDLDKEFKIVKKVDIKSIGIINK